jgi:hypothetical protein
MPARRAQPVRERAWKLADWTILLTDVPAPLLSLQEALVLVRERWQMEMLVPRYGNNTGKLMNGAQRTRGGCGCRTVCQADWAAPATLAHSPLCVAR